MRARLPLALVLFPGRAAATLCCVTLLSLGAVAAAEEDPSWLLADESDEARDYDYGPIENATPPAEVTTEFGLSGDWGGARVDLAERGIEISLDITQGVQGVMDGGFDEEADYLGSSELILDLASDGLGLWPGGFLRFAGEGRFGSDVTNEAGTLMPVNNDALFPANPDDVGDDSIAVTELALTQFLTPWFGFFGGLLNTTAGDANRYAGHLRSNQHFQNTAFVVNPVSLRIVPAVSLGGGVVLIPFDGLVASFVFISTEESTGQDPFDTSDGVTFVTEWNLDHELLDMPVRHVAAFAVGFDNDFFRLGDFPRLELPPPGNPPGLRFSTDDESWAFWYNGSLDLWNHEDDEDRRAGLFFRFGYADEDTNPIEWNTAVGLGAVGLFDLRPRDRVGIGVYHVEPSDNFPLPALGVGEETGFEVFYNAELRQGVNLSADLQYVGTSFGNGVLAGPPPDDALIGSLRLRVAF